MLGVLGPLREIHLFPCPGKIFAQYECPLDDPSIDLPLERPEIGNCKLYVFSQRDNPGYQEASIRSRMQSNGTYRIGNTFSLRSMIFTFDGLFAQYPSCINVSLVHALMVDLR